MNANDTVFVVDDEPSILKSLERLLRSCGFRVQTFPSAKAFLERHDPSAPGCLILDVVMPEQNGLELQHVLAASDCQLPIIFISGRSDVSVAANAMRAGAIHFLPKPYRVDDLVQAVREALKKDALARSAQAEAVAIRKRLATLTPRERQVFQHVVAGRLNKQIAADLGTVEKTVKVHRARMIQKMGVHSVAELVRIAERFGISSLP